MGAPQGTCSSPGPGRADERWRRWGRREPGWGSPDTRQTLREVGTGTHRGRRLRASLPGAHPRSGFEPGDVELSRLSGKREEREELVGLLQVLPHPGVHVLSSGPCKGLFAWLEPTPLPAPPRAPLHRPTQSCVQDPSSHPTLELPQPETRDKGFRNGPRGWGGEGCDFSAKRCG